MLRFVCCVFLALNSVALRAADLSSAVDALWSADAQRELRSDIDTGRRKPEFILPEVRVYDSAGHLRLQVVGSDATLGRIRAAVDAAAQNDRLDAAAVAHQIQNYVTRDGHPLRLTGLQPGSVLIVQHSAHWCVACRKLSPALDKLSDAVPEVLLVRIESDYPAMLRKQLATR